MGEQSSPPANAGGSPNAGGSLWPFCCKGDFSHDSEILAHLSSNLPGWLGPVAGLAVSGKHGRRGRTGTGSATQSALLWILPVRGRAVWGGRPARRVGLVADGF